MMINTRFLLLFFTVLLPLSGLFAGEPDFPESCGLPAPSWLKATDVTSSTIKVEWAAVPGAVSYRVERYDVTHSVQLPDVDVVGEEKYTSGPHDPGTTIRFTIYPKCQNQELGGSITDDYTTIIITVDDIASFVIPNPASGGQVIPPTELVFLEVKDANRSTPTVGVARLKLRTGIINGVEYFAEILVWSHCSTANSASAHVMYWKKFTWTPGVHAIEHHLNENPALPISSIEFKIGEHPFFTLLNPVFTAGSSVNLVGLSLRNDRPEIIYLDRSVNTEHNPCYIQQMVDGTNDQPQELAPLEAETSDRTALKTDVTGFTAPLARPNPFTGTIQLDFSLEEAGPATLKLSDCTGKTQRFFALPSLDAGHHTSYIDAAELPAGIYILTLQTGAASWTQKLIKAY